MAELVALGRQVLRVEDVGLDDDRDALDDLQPVYQAKYNWDISTDREYTFIIRVQPVKLLAWGSHGEGRWRWQDGGWRTA